MGRDRPRRTRLERAEGTHEGRQAAPSAAQPRVVELLEQLPHTGDFLFATVRKEEPKPLSNMAMLELLKRMGRSDITVHGMRSTSAIGPASRPPIHAKSSNTHFRTDWPTRPRPPISAGICCASGAPLWTTGRRTARRSGPRRPMSRRFAGRAWRNRANDQEDP